MLKINFLFVLLLSICCYQAKAQYTLVVDKNGTGNYTTVQEAINAVPTGQTSPYRIFIKKGIYKEVVTIPSNKSFVQLIGEDVATTIITFDNYSGKDNGAGGTHGTSSSATVTVNAPDFSAANITFANSTGDAPQAVAINVNNDRASFKNCRFLGGQDTLLANNSGMRQSYYQCYIEGVVDFIFGNARAVFDECILYPRDRVDGNSSYITAANTDSTEPYGYVFRDCKIIENRGKTKYVLGRPWQNSSDYTLQTTKYNKTVFLNTEMSTAVSPVGWAVWNAGTFTSVITYAEYNTKSIGGGIYDVSQRISWSKQFTSIEAAVYNDANLFQGWDRFAVFQDAQTVPTNRLSISNFGFTQSAGELSFTWNLNFPETNVTYRLYKQVNDGVATLVNEQTIVDGNVNVSYAPTTGKETIPPAFSKYTYYVVASSSNGSTTSESVSISAIPEITAGTITGEFKQGTNGPSYTKIYTLSAKYLAGNLTVTPPAGYDISADNGVNWFTSTSPLVLTPASDATVTKTITVRLNTAIASGTVSGNIVHESTGATTVNIAITGTKVNYSLVDLKELSRWALTADNAVTSKLDAVSASAPTFNGLTVSDGVTVTIVPAYSTAHGQAFGATATGLWGTSSGGPGGNLNRNYYEEFVIAPVSGKMLGVYELILTTNFYNTSSGTKIGVSYSTDDFVTTNEITGGYDASNVALVNTAFGAFAAPALIASNTTGTTQTLRFILNGDNGVTVAAGKQLKVRLYFSCSSSSAGRYGKLKDVYFKGTVDVQPLNGDYRTIKSGSWDDVTVWEKYNGTTWNTVTAYPVYNSGGTSYIEKGHNITLPTISAGSGYVNNFYVKEGAILLIPTGAVVKFASQSPNFTVDGELENKGSVSNNGAINMTVNGVLKNAGTGFKIGNSSGSLIINGSFENNSTAFELSNVTINGSYAHGVTSTLPSLTWGANGKLSFLLNYILPAAITINQLDLSNGIKLSLGNYTLTTSRIVGASSAGYVMFTGTGSLVLKNVGSTEVLLPLGTASGYSPVSIANTGTTSDFSVSVKSTIDNALPANSNKSVNLQWTIAPLTTGAKANLKFQWNATDHNAGFNPGSPIAVANYHNGAYVSYPATLSGTDPYVATISNVEQFSPFVVVNAEVLPLDLLSFEAKRTETNTNPKVSVTWKTTNEVNTEKFEVLRRTDNTAFEIVHSQVSKNTSGVHEYSFVDQMPALGKSYYQLKQYDKDGKFTLSDVKLVDIQSLEAKLQAYPNPAEGWITVTFEALSARRGELAVSDLQGRKLLSQQVKKGENSAKIDFGQLSSGFYLLTLIGENEKQTLKVLRK